VDIVSAGVHNSDVSRGVFKSRLLGDRQSIKLGTYTDGIVAVTYGSYDSAIVGKYGI
jgi:hypothetical protein